eukprot:scaffold508_cov554-Prasinococcus_capsulatus_cf.AAC.8
METHRRRGAARANRAPGAGRRRLTRRGAPPVPAPPPLGPLERGPRPANQADARSLSLMRTPGGLFPGR